MEKIRYEKILKDIERVYFELQNNIKLRNEFDVEYRKTWKVIKSQRIDQDEKMTNLSRKKGQATFNIDNNVSELISYSVVHKAFDLALAYINKEIERCAGIIKYTNYVIDGFKAGKHGLINSKAEPVYSSKSLEEYCENKQSRMQRLLETRGRLLNRGTGEDFSKFVKTEDEKPYYELPIRITPPKMKKDNYKGNNHNQKSNQNSLPKNTNEGFQNYIENNYRDYIRTHNPVEEAKKIIDRQDRKTKPQEKKVNHITNFSKYKNETFDTISPDNDLIRVNYRPSRFAPNSMKICYWKNKNEFIFQETEGREKCIEVRTGKSDDSCFCPIDLVNHGNIYIEGDLTCEFFEKNAYLNEFIANLMMRYLDLYPPYSLRIHVVDSFENRVLMNFIKAFCNNIKTKNIVNLYKNFSSCKEQLDKKSLSVSNDVYDLVIIRNLPNSEMFNETIDDIYRMMQDESKEHEQNIRFITCIDQSKYIERGKDFSTVIDKIKQTANYTYRMLNKDDMFCLFKSFRKDDALKTKTSIYNITYQLRREGKLLLDEFILQKCENIASYIQSIEKSHDTVEDLQDIEKGDPYQEIIKIPVGYSNDAPLNIEFGCGGGQNIGLMVIGRTGSGKSSLYNALVINGALKYSPNDINFWLLDFKNNAAAGLYTSLERDVPHIKLVSHDSKRIDGDIILSLLVSELNIRGNLFNELHVATGEKIDNLVTYNKVVDQSLKNDKHFKHLPRTVLLVDEIQELFRQGDPIFDDLTASVANKINELANKGRYAGIHMAFFAQNLDSTTKVDQLSEAFIHQITYRATFNLDSNSLAASQFGEEFRNNAEKIEKLNKGEICINTSSGIKFAKVTYIDQVTDYCNKIISKYDGFKSTTLVIGKSDKLSPMDHYAKNGELTYLNLVLSPLSKDGLTNLCIGEDAFTLNPFRLLFSKKADSNVFLVGSDELVKNSILSSVVIGIKKLGLEYTAVSSKDESLFTKLIKNDKCFYSLDEANEAIANCYHLFMNRKSGLQSSDKPFFFIVNGLELSETLDLHSFYKSEDRGAVYSSFDDDSRYSENYSGIEEEEEGITLSEMLEKIADQGWKYNVYLIATLNNVEFSEFESSIQGTNNLIVFNDLNYNINSNVIGCALNDVRASSNQIMHSITDDYLFDEPQKVNNESFAFRLKKDTLIKFRPVIYSNEGIDRVDYEYILNLVED